MVHDLDHFLFECNMFEQEGAALTNKIMELILKNNLPYTNGSVPLLLGDLEDIPRSVRLDIRRAGITFLTDTCSDIKI